MSDVKERVKNTNWVKAACVRAVKTICQCALGIIGSSLLLSEVDWTMLLSASALAGIVSLLTSVAKGLPEVDE